MVSLVVRESPRSLILRANLRQEVVTVLDDYMFIRPSFARGVARVMDIGGALGRDAFVTARSVREADERALRSDFRAVNRDLRVAWVRLREQLARTDGGR